MSQQEPIQGASVTPQASLPVDYTTWNDYWTRARHQPWRTEPEIGGQRLHYLTKRLTIEPDIEHSV